MFAINLFDTKQQGFTTYLGPLKIAAQNLRINQSANLPLMQRSLNYQAAKAAKKLQNWNFKKPNVTLIIIMIFPRVLWINMSVFT